MLNIVIKDKLDYNYPKQLLTKGKLLFHGTGKIFADVIEKNGFESSIKPYDIEDIKSLLQFYHALGYGKHVSVTHPSFLPSDVDYRATVYWQLQHYVLQGNDHNGYVDLTSPYASFTYNYWQAGGYSTKPGGETITLFIKGIMELQNLIRDVQRLQNHYNEIINETQLSNLDSGISKTDILSNICNVDFLNHVQEETWKLYNKQIPFFENITYENLAKTHSPEIIVTDIEESKLKNKKGKVDGLQNDLIAEIEIPPENIVARISFVEGHKIPTPWDVLKMMIVEMGGYEWAQTADINKKIVSKYGNALEDPKRQRFGP